MNGQDGYFYLHKWTDDWHDHPSEREEIEFVASDVCFLDQEVADSHLQETLKELNMDS